MQDTTEPLRLAQNILPRLRVGAGASDGSTGLCGMQVISWENGDTEITDMPGCADPFLARVVQRVNDSYCAHTQGGLLCPECSVAVLALAHRTVGTALDLPDAERARVYVTLAVEQAEGVLHLTTDERPRGAVALVRRFLAGEDVALAELHAAANAARAAYAAYAARAANAARAAYAAANAAYAAANAAYAAANAAYAAANAANAAYAAYAAAYAAAYDAAYDAAKVTNQLDRAHRVIDRFEELTGVRARPVPEQATRQALAAMCG